MCDATLVLSWNCSNVRQTTLDVVQTKIHSHGGVQICDKRLFMLFKWKPTLMDVFKYATNDSGCCSNENQLSWKVVEMRATLLGGYDHYKFAQLIQSCIVRPTGAIDTWMSRATVPNSRCHIVQPSFHVMLFTWVGQMCDATHSFDITFRGGHSPSHVDE